MVRLVAAALALLVLVACRANPPTPTATTDALRILVAQDGVYRLPLAALRQAGLEIGELSAANLHLSSEGRPAPFLIDGESLIFYGQGPQSRYTARQAYILRAGEPGLLMQVAEAPPAGAEVNAVWLVHHLEENWEYLPDARYADAAEPWFWQTLPLQGSLELTVSAANAAHGTGELKLQLYGASHSPAVDPDHSLAVAVNGVRQGEIFWDGQAGHAATIALPPRALQNGDNTITLENLPEDFLDIIKLDWLRVGYHARPIAANDRLTFSAAPGTVTLQGFSAPPLLLDVSDPGNPTRLGGWEEMDDGGRFGSAGAADLVAVGPDGYLQVAAIAPLREGGWRAAERQADLIIITTDELAPALAPLVSAREEQGLQVAVVPVGDIYDEFGAGMETPDSIRAFVAYAAAQWAEPAPRYLLLVGDGTSDYREYLATHPDKPVTPPQNIVPPFMVAVSFSGETVSDARLADVDGDMRPDLAIGRWPVDNVAAVESLVRRTLAYESAAPQPQALFVSDPSSQSFSNMTERLVAGAELAPASTSHLIGPAGAGLASAWKEGAWLVTYTGHGSLQLWGKDSILAADAVSSLAGAASAPLVVQLTCLTGLFAHPEITSLAEQLLAYEDGPVLTVAATSLTLSSHQEPFALAFLQAVQEPAVERVGDALQIAKQGLDVTNDGLREISDTFGLLGDPSALLVRP